MLEFNDGNWMITLGNSSGAMVSRVARNGEGYFMTYKYLVYDYYDWELDSTHSFAGLRNAELAQMNHAGMAKDITIMVR